MRIIMPGGSGQMGSVLPPSIRTRWVTVNISMTAKATPVSAYRLQAGWELGARKSF